MAGAVKTAQHAYFRPPAIGFPQQKSRLRNTIPQKILQRGNADGAMEAPQTFPLPDVCRLGQSVPSPKVRYTLSGSIPAYS